MSTEARHWEVEFYDFMSGSRDVAGFGDLHERAARNGAQHGTPVIVTQTGDTDPRVNLFFRTGRMSDAASSTWRRYAYSLAVWLNFLHAFEQRWDRATVRDLEVFKHWRLTDHANDGRVAPTSFDADRAALKTFYDWASARYSVGNPVLAMAGAARRPGYRVDHVLDQARGVGRDPFRPAGARRRQIKWMQRPAFEQWRDIGLRGYDFGGLRRPGWRGECEDRDVAFVDGLYGTGLRLREWASVLDVELPTVGETRFPKAWLAAACVKGRRQGREYRIPRTVLRSLASYLDPLEGSRVEAVHRAQLAGRYDRVSGKRIVTAFHPRSRTLDIETDHGPAQLPLDVLDPDERRLLFRRTASGLEPVAVWLRPDGLPKKAHGWEDTFAAANERVAEAWIATTQPALRGQEREARKARCPLWCRPHMCRHSFALKWFTILTVVWEQRIEGFTAAEIADLREQFGDIWYQMAALLGHAHPETARNTYLEPFAALQLDYLTSLLDEDEADGVNALVRAVANDSGRVLTAVSADRWSAAR